MIKSLLLSILFLSIPISAMNVRTLKKNWPSQDELTTLKDLHANNKKWKMSEIEYFEWTLISILKNKNEENKNNSSHLSESWYKLHHELKVINSSNRPV